MSLDRPACAVRPDRGRSRGSLGFRQQGRTRLPPAAPPPSLCGVYRRHPFQLSTPIFPFFELFATLPTSPYGISQRTQRSNQKIQIPQSDINSPKSPGEASLRAPYRWRRRAELRGNAEGGQDLRAGSILRSARGRRSHPPLCRDPALFPPHWRPIPTHVRERLGDRLAVRPLNVTADRAFDQPSLTSTVMTGNCHGN